MSELYNSQTTSTMLAMETALAWSELAVKPPDYDVEDYADMLLHLASLPADSSAEVESALTVRARLDDATIPRQDRLGIWLTNAARRLTWDDAIRLEPGFTVRHREMLAPLPMAGSDIELAVYCTQFFGAMRVGPRHIELGAQTPVYEAFVVDASDEDNPGELAWACYMPSQESSSFTVVEVEKLSAYLPGLPDEPKAQDVINVAASIINERQVW